MKQWSDPSPYIASRQFLGRRSTQQDRFSAGPFASERNEDGILVVMADGHAHEGDAAADRTVTRIREGILEACDRGRDALAQTFLGAHDLVLRNEIRGGTTATCVTVHADKLVAAWVGNTEARIVTAGGDLRTLSIPHEYGVHRGETARLDALGARIGGFAELGENGRPRRGHVVIDGERGETWLECTRVIGDPEFDAYVLHEPEIVEREPAPEDRWLIVATDGLWHAAKRTHKRHLIGRTIAASLTAEEAAAKLERLVNAWRPADNVTYVIVDLVCLG
ncbi:MAG TPA: PP2C family protein-serine/threonine phosphatase [Candidatus Binatia bacterium]|jgi:serine/threonine protein phosphatase PrpC|nr:PP2C family protein-serine/threonine phosphatase [Candidatus Binatia bacterium]